MFPDEKFTFDYVERINRLFDKNDHFFWIYKDSKNDKIKKVSDSNVMYSKQCSNVFKEYMSLCNCLRHSDRVIVHSLFVPFGYLVVLAFLSLFHPKKFFWNIWGADLYNSYWMRNSSLKHKLKDFVKRIFIRHIGSVGYIKSDYDFLKLHYKTKAKFFISSYTYDFHDLPSDSSDSDSINILIGNSATRECQYEEIIELLSQIKKQLKVFCVLAYPDNKEADEYREKIIKMGNDLLGDRFIPLVDYVSYDDYMKLLSGIDIAIFNHNRQQALGNIASLLYLKKKVFINPLNGCKQYFEDLGAKVFSTNDLTENDVVKQTDFEYGEKNRSAIMDFFNDKHFYERWNDIFEYDRKR